MLDVIKKRRGEAAAADSDSENEQMHEMGEEELSEGYLGQEEGEYEMEDEDGEDEEVEAPSLIDADEQGINNERRVETESNSDISDINVDDYGSSSSSEYDSDELAKDTTANPHGFVFSNMLETFQKSRKERIGEMKDAMDH